MKRLCLSCAIAITTAFSPAAIAECLPDGVQDSGSIYRICLPPPGEYNGKLVIWAHGFQDATEPVSIPEGQLQFGDVYLPDLITGLGFGFATNSYSKTGLAILEGMDDILDLVNIYADEVGEPSEVYLTGASEGGIITTLLVEQHPDIFSGGVAACGPIGDFPAQIKYFGDARATFEFYFPTVIPGDPFNPPQWLVEEWTEFYDAYVEPVIFHPDNATTRDLWAAAAKLPVDPGDYIESLRVCARDVLRYSVVNLNDAAETLGGFPFENRYTIYTGVPDPFWLNIFVPRVAASPAAVAEMENFYQTTGELEVPLITMHTTLDQQVPDFHADWYNWKSLVGGSLIAKHLPLRYDRFGHCNFNEDEALLAFFLLLIYNGDWESLF